MRKLATLESSKEAWRLRWYLMSCNIEARVEDISSEDKDVWVMEDRQLGEAKQLLASFIKNPDSPQFVEAEKIGRKKFDSLQKELLSKKPREVNVRTEVFSKGVLHGGMTTSFVLIALCVAYFVIQFVDKERWLMRQLMISQDVFLNAFGVKSFREVFSGQIWRLVTPIFIHNDFFHILFNMYWLYTLGRMVEPKLGGLRFLALILIIAAPSNTLFYLVSGPVFGGMSGVIYGLFAFMWVCNRLSTKYQFFIDDGLIKFFSIFYVICWILSVFGILRVANTVHGMGAFMGALIAFMISGQLKRYGLKRLLNQSNLYNVLIIFAQLWKPHCLVQFGIQD